MTNQLILKFQIFRNIMITEHHTSSDQPCSIEQFVVDLEENLENFGVLTRLSHLNKTRPKRNVKPPTQSNPYAALPSKFLKERSDSLGNDLTEEIEIEKLIEPLKIRFYFID